MDQEEYKRAIKEDPSIAQFLEYNKGSWRNRPYWRAKPYYRSQPTTAQNEHRIKFTESAISAYGKKGLTKVNGALMPQASKSVQENLSGKMFAETTVREKKLQSTKQKIQEMQWQKTRQSLHDSLKALAEFTRKGKAKK
jgi:hypothetical protein